MTARGTWVRVNILQIKILLIDSKPPIWRRVLLRDTMTLEELHWVIQIAMPWTNSHLHQFLHVTGTRKNRPTPEDIKRLDTDPTFTVNQMYGETYYSDPDFKLENVEDETRVTLRDLSLHPKSKLLYTYDMGDSWDHQLVVEKVLEPDPKQKYPICVAGKLNAPPDDCGGIPGFYDLLDAIDDPNHPNHKGMKEWSGEYDPKACNLEEINKAFRKNWKR